MLLKDSSRTKNNQELVRASIDALVKALEGGHSEALSAYLNAMSQFHNYSFQNILLIASQRPSATRVAGIRSWNCPRRSHERNLGAGFNCPKQPQRIGGTSETTVVP